MDAKGDSRVAVERVVVRVGRRRLELTMDEVRELHRALGQLVAEPVVVGPVVIREVVREAAPVSPWPVIPFDPNRTVPSPPPYVPQPYPYIGDLPGWWESPTITRTIGSSGGMHVFLNGGN